MSREQGLTRLEWLFLTAIISVLILIAAPSFFLYPQRVCASKQSIGRSIIGDVIKLQKIYHQEHGEFIHSIQQIEQVLNWQPRNKYWRVSIEERDEVIVAYATARQETVGDAKLYSYVGLITFDDSTNEYLSIVCRTIKPSTIQAEVPIQEENRFLFWQHNEQFSCAAGTHDC